MATPIGVYELVTAPALEPVTLAEIKEHARIDGSDEDAYLTLLITAARELVERWTGRCIITQTWKLTLDDWPAGGADEWWDGVREGPITMLRDQAWVELRKSPIAAITSVVTKDEADAETTWDSANYYLARQPNGYGRATRKAGQTWPIVVDRAAGGIVITFTAGYGAAASAVPMALRHAVKMLATHWYEHREPASACAASNLMPAGLASLVASYRVAR
jgi:uncharacterized phiE125 gp8 family phage protein